MNCYSFEKTEDKDKRPLMKSSLKKSSDMSMTEKLGSEIG